MRWLTTTAAVPAGTYLDIDTELWQVQVETTLQEDASDDASVSSDKAQSHEGAVVQALRLVHGPVPRCHLRRHHMPQHP
jgi:hypothetical protein